MKKHILFFLLFFIPSICLAQVVPAPLNWEEEDTNPSIYPYKIKVTNGTLTDNGDGTGSLDISGTGDADQNLWETFNADGGSTTANSITDTLTVSGTGTVTTSIAGDTLTIDGSAAASASGGSNTHVQFNKTGVLAGDPAFSFDESNDAIYMQNAHIVGDASMTGDAHVIGSLIVGTIDSSSSPITIAQDTVVQGTLDADTLNTGNGDFELPLRLDEIVDPTSTKTFGMGSNTKKITLPFTTLQVQRRLNLTPQVTSTKTCFTSISIRVIQLGVT